MPVDFSDQSICLGTRVIKKSCQLVTRTPRQIYRCYKNMQLMTRSLKFGTRRAILLGWADVVLHPMNKNVCTSVPCIHSWTL